MSDFALTNPVPVGGRESHDHYPTPSRSGRHSGRRARRRGSGAGGLG